MLRLSRNPRERTICGLFLAIAVGTSALVAQTQVTPPKNKYTPKQDVQIGQQAAADVEKQIALLPDEVVTAYVRRIGEALERAVPVELQHAEFRYTFKVVNAKEINAFALPGGPMYVNRGMISAANTEGEVAGVMAHELSHVALRHGTAQATKAEKYQYGALAGAIIGSVIGGGLGEVVSQGSQFGIGTVFLRFSREYEKQADILGSHIMASAGYDPRDMANMFRTIEKQSGGGGPQWMSDHPNPGNRSAYIDKEATYLRVENPVQDTRDFTRVQARLREMPPAPTAEEVARNRRRGPTNSGPDTGGLGGRIETPSSSYRTYNEGNLFTVSVPVNWREMATNSTVKFVPDGAYGQVSGQSVFTHGVEFGLTRNETHSLREATEELVDALARSNRRLRQETDYQRGVLAGRDGLNVTLSNTSEVTGRPEVINIVTTLMRDGNLFYAIAVAPKDEYGVYQPAFRRVTRSIQIND